MSGFWEKKGLANNMSPEQHQELVLDEQAVAEIQGEHFETQEDEDEDTSELMFDANLRLEQGRLYQMIMRHDLFGETDADPKAIRNVQREIRKFVRERMETMLGIRQEQSTQQTVVSSPFNDLEVAALKMLASKISKGATESPSVQIPSAPKKDGITSVSGSLRADSRPATLVAQPKKPAPKAAAKPSPKAEKPEESALQKPIDQMSPEELLEHNRKAEERSKSKYAKNPVGMVPHPTLQQLEALYTVAAANTTIANAWRTGGQ